MNEDDYNFDSTDNSRLSMLFSMDYKAGNSNLTYKAPRQPQNISTSKTFHKYIKLYHNNNATFHGKYIIAIVTIGSNFAELLLYQTKANILVRKPVVEQLLYTCTTNNSLILNANDEQYKLEFENENDLLDFTKTYVQAGGLLESLKKFELYHDFTRKTSEKDNYDTKVNPSKSLIFGETERSTLTCAERLDLPNCISFEKSMQNISCGNKIVNNMASQGVDESSSNIKAYSLTSDGNHASRDKNYLCTSKNLTQEQNSLLTTLLLDSQTNNSKLRDAIYLLISKLNEIIPFKESNEILEIKNLKSKMKSLELKSENLQSELKNFRKNKNLCETSCQTYNSCYADNETTHLRSIVIQAMDIIKYFSFTPDKITELRNWAEKIEDDQLVLSLHPYLNCIEERKIKEAKSDHTVLRNKFVGKLKETMNTMYQNICSSEQNVDVTNLLAQQIKLASLEIVDNFDNCLQEKAE